jgi:hypothetical protein
MFRRPSRPGRRATVDRAEWPVDGSLGFAASRLPANQRMEPTEPDVFPSARSLGRRLIRTLGCVTLAVMKFALINKAQKWGAVFLPCLLLVAERCPAQFVEVYLQIEGTSWPLDSSGQQSEHHRIYNARCVFGSSNWLIEGEFTLNAKETWWCTGTNIIKHTLITKELRESERQLSAFRSLAGPPLHVGERFTTIYGPSDRRPLHGIADVTWLAFCSGSFLKAEGRRILPPFTTGAKENDYSDKAQFFDDVLGLPKRVEIYSHEKELVSTYEVQQSTNFAGWIVPLRFELTQHNNSGKDSVKPFWRASAKVTSIQVATQPLVPPEVMKQPRR